MTSEKLKLMSTAYSWEKDRMQAWIDETKKHLGSDEQNPVKKILNEAWLKYFKYLQDSNQMVIDVCNKEKVDEQTKKNLILNEVRGEKECVDVRAQIEDFLK